MFKLFEAQRLLKNREISSVELTKMVLDNIKAKDDEINSYITVCAEEAMKQAELADRVKEKSFLCGIPIAVKDNICTKGVLTTAASKMLSEFMPPYDATVVKKLKDENAVIIGKTNMDEFGMGSANDLSYYGRVKNPVCTDFVTGGSSGGSAAAVKAGLAVASLGTDTGGSIRQPASFTGVCGLKPTYSLVSRYGLIAYASSLDTIGPMCSCVTDVALLLNAITGKDKLDATSVNSDKKDYTKALKENVKDLKIGIIKEIFEICDDEIKACVKKAALKYEELGAKVEECSLESIKYANSAYKVITSAEASSNLSRYDGVKYTKRIQGKDLEEMYVNTRSECFGDEVKKRIIFGTMILSEGKYSLYYQKARKAADCIKKEVEALFEKYDVLLTPTSAVKAWKAGESGIDEKKDINTVWVNLAQVPALSIPCGKDSNDMPVGMQLVGNMFCEETIINAAYAYERMSGNEV